MNKDDLGSGTGPHRCHWWIGESVETKHEEVKMFRETWACPMDDCDGEMKTTGNVWPMDPPGVHHECTECGVVLALSDERYPKITYEPPKTPS